MKVEELRIGNWVNFHFHKDSGGLKAVRFFNSDFKHMLYRSELYQPIPLTEEWLLKFGFSKKETYYIKTIKLFNELEVYGFQGDASIGITSKYPKTKEENRVFIGFIDYVHQLQNLYFALTGEGLTIKE